MLLRNACLRSLSTAKSGCHRWPTPPSSATHSVSVAGCANGGFDQAQWATAAVTSAASRGALGSPCVSRRRLSTARGMSASAATRGRSFIQVASFATALSAPCTCTIHARSTACALHMRSHASDGASVLHVNFHGVLSTSGCGDALHMAGRLRVFNSVFLLSVTLRQSQWSLSGLLTAAHGGTRRLLQ